MTESSPSYRAALSNRPAAIALLLAMFCPSWGHLQSTATGQSAAANGQTIREDSEDSSTPTEVGAQPQPDSTSNAVSEPRASSPSRATAARRNRLRRLQRKRTTPPPNGDFFYNGGLLLSGAYSGLPLAGGAPRAKISDNSMALPTDRFYFLFHHFHNSIDTFALGIAPRSVSINQYTVGFEKTICCGDASIEVRMPFTDEFDSGVLGIGMGTVSGGNIGNLAVTYKEKLYENDSTVCSAGLGISIPTGSDVVGTEAGDPFRVKNEAVNLLPFVGFMSAPDDRRFYHGFVQVDVPANGNSLIGIDPMTFLSTTETIRNQTLLYIDLAAGYWLHRFDTNYCLPSSQHMTGIAALLELHYTTSLQDPDVGTIIPEFVSGRIDVLNLTTGIHFEFGPALALRVAGVFPLERTEISLPALSNVESRGPFDAEVQASLIRRF